MLLRIGRIGRAHGIRGDVAVATSTDDPDARFAPGARIATQPAEAGPLEVESARWHSGRLLVRFVGISDRTKAETIKGLVLVVDSDDLPPIDEADEYYDHQLIGLHAETSDGAAIGEITDVVHGPAGELLVIDRDGREVLVPFVTELVPTVDLVARRVTVTPQPGLLDEGE